MIAAKKWTGGQRVYQYILWSFLGKVVCSFKKISLHLQTTLPRISIFTGFSCLIIRLAKSRWIFGGSGRQLFIFSPPREGRGFKCPFCNFRNYFLSCIQVKYGSSPLNPLKSLQSYFQLYSPCSWRDEKKLRNLPSFLLVCLLIINISEKSQRNHADHVLRK